MVFSVSKCEYSIIVIHGFTISTLCLNMILFQCIINSDIMTLYWRKVLIKFFNNIFLSYKFCHFSSEYKCFGTFDYVHKTYETFLLVAFDWWQLIELFHVCSNISYVYLCVYCKLKKNSLNGFTFIYILSTMRIVDF